MPGTKSNDLVALEHAARVAAGQADRGDVQWLQRGFEAWARSGGAVPLERCLHLPRTEAQMLRLQRDTWLSTVAAELRTDPALHDASTWLLARRTAEELDRFVSRGPWREWRTAGLPDGSSRLREALYHVALANAGQDLSARQVLRILGQASSVLCH